MEAEKNAKKEKGKKKEREKEQLWVTIRQCAKGRVTVKAGGNGEDT